MRYYYTLVLVFFSTVCFPQSNVYHPFPDSNAIWRITEYDSSTPFGTLLSVFQVTMDRDTILNGHVYHNLYREGDFYINSPWYNGGSTEDWGILWQDTALKQVYFREYLCPNCDSLLYDFNLQVGDTLKNTSNFTQTGASVLVHSIDSIMIGNSFHKRFKIANIFNVPNGTYLIEGIGTTLGGFYQYEYFEQYFDLVCFTLDSQTVYPDTLTNCDMIIANNPDLPDTFNQTIVIPNPFNQYIKIITNNPITEIHIYNSIMKELKNIYFDKNIIYFDDNISSGIYFIYFIEGSNMFKKFKMIKL